MTAEVAGIIISRNGAGKIGPAIASLQAWAHRVHVFVDAATTDATRAVAAAAGATVHDIVTPGFIEGALAEAHRRAGSRYVLRLDDDERLALPAGVDPARHRAGLLAAMDLHGISHVRFQRRWFLPGDTHYITDSPWWPDHQLRLFDLARCTVTWPTKPHDWPDVVGNESLCDDAVIDHLDFCHTSAAERRAKAAAYTAINPGAASVESYYRFEEYRLTVMPRHVLVPPAAPR